MAVRRDHTAPYGLGIVMREKIGIRRDERWLFQPKILKRIKDYLRC